MGCTPVSADTLSLRECADRLGVHYMTAYIRAAWTPGDGPGGVAALEALSSEL